MPLISLLALLALIVGLFVERKGYASPGLNRTLSRVLVQFVYPCLIFSSLLLRFDWPEVQRLVLLPLMVFALCGAGLIFGKSSVSLAQLDEERSRRSYVFLAIMPNYSFVPLVIAQTIWGDQGLALVALSSIGADIFVWTLAYPQIAGKRDWRKVLSPALITLLLALLLLSLSVDIHQPTRLMFLTALSWIGKATLPLSMYVLGTQLARAKARLHHRRAHGLLLAWRLILCPLAMFGVLLVFGTELNYVSRAILLLIASMPGAVVSVVLAQLHDADGELAATQILMGHILGILTVGFWQLLLYQTQALFA